MIRLRLKLIIVLVSLAVVLVPQASVAALTLEQKIFNAQNNIIMYEDDCEESEKTGTCVAPTGDQITWIGDSYSVGAESGFYGNKQGVHLISEKFPGVDLGDAEMGSTNSYIQSGRFIDYEYTTKDGITVRAGLDILQEIVNAGKLRSYLVFALGTNGGDWDTDKINRVLDLVGSNTKVILMTSKTEVAGQDYTSNNEKVKQFAKDHPDQIYVADYASVAKSEWYDADPEKIHPNGGDGYDVFTDTIKNTLPQNCTAGMLPGNNIEEKIWNWFVKADIDGVSDNGAAIAGIMGNFFGESSYNLLQYGCALGVCGGALYGLLDTWGGFTELRERVNTAIGKDLWETSGYDWDIEGYPTKLAPDKALADAGVTEEELNTIIDIELTYFITENARFNGSGNGWNADQSFMKSMGNVDDPNSPESYSDLFVVTVEGAVYNAEVNCTPVLDGEAIRQIRKFKDNYNDLAQGAEERRGYARTIYDRLANSANLVATSGDSDFSTTSTYSVSGSKKYTLTDSQLQDLAELARYIKNLNKEDRPEAFQSANTDEEILSLFADLFEKSNPSVGDADASDALYNFIKDSDFYKNCPDLLNGVRDHPEVTEEVAKSVLNDGLRATSTNRLQTSDPNAGAKVCEDSSKKKSSGAARIAEAAVQMSWPVIKANESFEESHVGECANDGRDSKTYNSWVSYSDGSKESCYYTPRKMYRDNYLGQVYTNVFNPGSGFTDRIYMDCSYFVGTVLNYVFGQDYGFPTGGPSAQLTFFQNHPEDWQEIENTGTTDELKPGDVLVKPPNEHIMIYVGSYGGEYGPWSQASADTEVGLVKSRGSYDNFKIYRYKGTALGGDFGEGGEAIGNAAEYLAWPEADQEKGYAGTLTEEYKAARDEWFGPDPSGIVDDVSCARFASLSILVSGVDEGFQVTTPPSRSNIRWIQSENTGLEGYLKTSTNYENVTGKGDYRRGDIFIRSDSSPHVFIYLGSDRSAEGAGCREAGCNGNSTNNWAGMVMTRHPEDSVKEGYHVYRLKE